jgi:hypothetical protein
MRLPYGIDYWDSSTMGIELLDRFIGSWWGQGLGEWPLQAAPFSLRAELVSRRDPEPLRIERQATFRAAGLRRP